MHNDSTQVNVLSHAVIVLDFHCSCLIVDSIYDYLLLHMLLHHNTQVIIVEWTLYVGMARICAEMRRTLKASKLSECENDTLLYSTDVTLAL